MLKTLYLPHLVTSELMSWCKSFVSYDSSGRCGVTIKDELAPFPQELVSLVEAVDNASYNRVILQAYKDGSAITPCHTDGPVVSHSFVFSLGATRTFKIHQGPCESPTEVHYLSLPSGMVVIMTGDFQEKWHHQVIEDPGVTEERLSLVVGIIRR